MSYVTRGSVLAIGVVFVVASISAVGTRFVLRLRHDGVGTDDWLCLAALVLVLGGCADMMVGFATHSIGTHSPPGVKPWPDSEMTKKLEYVMYMIFVPALVLLKLSTLFFYRRIFRGRAFNICFWTLVTLSVLWGITFFTAFASACPEVKWFWVAVKTKCADTFTMLLLQSILDVIVDLAILILPIPFVFRLKMPLGRKFAICCTLAVGMLAIACGITRMSIFIQTLAVPWLSTPTVAGMRFNDWRGVISALCIWTMLEMGVAIVAICLPTFRPAFGARRLESLVSSFRSLVSIRSDSQQAATSVDSEDKTQPGEKREMTYRTGRHGSTASATFDEGASFATLAVEANVAKHQENVIIETKTVELTTVTETHQV